MEAESLMADQTYDIEQFATHLGNALTFLKQPGGQDASGATQTGDVINQVHGAQAQSPYGVPGSATPMSGGLDGGAYDGFGISQEYGVGGHPGLDIATPVGTKLLAPVQGTVTHAANDDPGGYGSWVEITAADGTVIRYGHLSNIMVKTGQQVGPGTMVGLSGGTAGASGSGNATGPHLHFEVHSSSGGPSVNPSNYLAGGWQIIGQ